MLLGTGLILAGGVLGVLLLAFAPPNIFLFFLPMMVLAFGNGILTVENHDQAEVRANPEKSDKGGE